MPSYSQYKRQMAVMDADDANIETWITVKGNHIPIMKGQSKEEAVQSFLEKKGKSSGGSKSSSGEKPAKKVSQSLKDDVDYYFTGRQAGEKVWNHWNKIREDVINKRGEGVFKDIRAVQNTGYYTPDEILNALEDGKKFDDMVSKERDFQASFKKKEKPANKGWMNARSSHPETIGKVVRRVVKKIGEARKENSWTMADGTNVSVKNGVVTFNKNGKTKSMSEKEWAKLSKNPPSGSARGIFDD